MPAGPGVESAAADPLTPELRGALAHHRSGRRVEAERVYRRVIDREPDGARKAHALHLLGLLARDCRHLTPAAELLGRSVAMLPAGDPAGAEFRSNWGAALHDLNRPREAAEVLREATRLGAANADAHHNLGVVLERLGQLDEAEAALRRAIEVRPEFAAGHNRLGTVLRRAGRVDEAEASHRRALVEEGDNLNALIGLAHVHCDQGRVAESSGCYRRIVAAGRDHASTHSDLLYTLHYDDGQTPESLFAEHLEWARRHAGPLAGEAVRPHGNDPDPDRRLRIGYVSADLRGHPVARFIEAALAHHDRTRVDVFCYSGAARPDATSARLRKLAHAWRDTALLSDAALAEQVRGDRIDVLVDLDGHASGGPRMRLFARKPAPVQVAYNGYVNTTGLRAMDWRITDAHHDPPGLTERYHTEKLYRLNACNWCYKPDDDSPEVAPPPARRNGYVTFGSLNKFVKASPRAMRLWARILRAVPRSKLRLAVLGGPATNRHPLEALARCGVPSDRIELVPKTPTRRQYLHGFDQIDVCLDPFPFNGITTTCDSIWMGVPVVSLAGDAFASRAGVSLLTAAGVPELIALTEDQYVRNAAELADDPARLAALRAQLRSRMAGSVLCDGPGLAHRLETAYRLMWRGGCRPGAA